MAELDLRELFEEKRARLVLEEARWWRTLMAFKAGDFSGGKVRETLSRQTDVLELVREPIPVACTPDERRELDLLLSALLDTCREVLDLMHQRRDHDLEQGLRRILDEDTP